jgi:thiol-disulfide isomerase/thioredoxin
MIKELTGRDLVLQGTSVYIKDMTTPGMLLVWATWCGYCHRFLPDYAKLDQTIGDGFALTSIEESTFASGTDAVNALKIQGFPTIKFFDETGRIVSHYEGPRTVPDISKYICKFYHKCMQ